MKNPETYRTLDVSTAHITEDDSRFLSQDEDEILRDANLIVRAHEYGWLVYTGMGVETIERDKLSPALVHLIDTAARLGCKWIDLDCDGPRYPDLEEFDW